MLKTTLAVALMAVQASTSPPRVAAALLKSAELDPIEFTMVLLQAGVSAGLEVRSADQSPRRKPDLQLASSPTVNLTEVVSAFNSAHTDYRAKLDGHVVVIRPVDKPAPYLDQPSSAGRIDVTGVMSAARKIFSPLDRTLDAPGGIIGSRIGVDAAQAGENTRITIDGSGRRNEQLLNEVVSRSPRAWIVVTTNSDETIRIIKVGFMHPGGSTTFLDVHQGTR